jgi:hypothetical protein
MKAMMKRTHELSLFEVGISNVVGLEPLANLKLDRQCQDSESPATSAKGKGKADNSQPPKARSLK